MERAAASKKGWPPVVASIKLLLHYAHCMKVLIDQPYPFLLAHGGFQTQIQQTKAALEGIGVDVDLLRWWSDTQPCDLIHYFGRPFSSYVDLAHRKGIKVVFSALH